jgi:hypothetical protein
MNGGAAEAVESPRRGTHAKGYQGQCWNCGEPGAYAGGWQMTCPECDVSWTAWPTAPRRDPKNCATG